MTERDEFTLNMEYSNGQSVDITVYYEHDQALGALEALRQAGSDEYIVPLLEAFADDASIIQAIGRADALAAVEEEDDDWYPEIDDDEEYNDGR